MLSFTSMQRPPPVHDLHAYLEWLSGDPQAGVAEAERLLAVPAGERDAWVAAHPEVVNFHAVDHLLEIARDRLRDDPEQALGLTGLVVRHHGQLRVPQGSEVAGAIQRVDAWRLYGQALRAAGDLDAAETALERAVAYGAGPPVVRRSVLAARRELAFLAHLRGRGAAAVELLDDLIPEHQALADAGGVVETVLYRSQIELALGRQDRARGSAEEALRLAAEIGFPARQADAHDQLRHLAEQRQDSEAAARHARLAAELRASQRRG